MKIAAIVPAFNEEIGIAGVLAAVTKSEVIDEIIVVSDGSTDDTVAIAKSFKGITIIEQHPNKGKAAAMQLGVEATDASVIVFIDADLIGLTPGQVTALAKPIVDDCADLTMGLFQGGKFSTDWAQKLFPFLTGQRGMKREVWEGAKVDVNSGYGVEIQLTKYIAAHNLRVENVLLNGCTQIFKEQKTKGKAMKGFARRMKMVWDISKMLFSPNPPEYKKAAGKKRKKKH